MFAFRSLLIVLFLVVASVSGLGAEAHGEVTEGAHGAEGEVAEHHGLTPNAVPLFKLGPLVITNSMVVTWIVAALIILLSQMATRKAKLVPSGLQNFWEWLVEELYGFFESILGPVLVKKTFWFFATIFIFILFTNWFGLIPGLGSIGWGTYDAAGHFHMSEPLLRGVNADLNMTAAMALTFFALWLVWAFQANGIQGFAGHIFAVKGHGANFMGFFLVVVFIFVGLIEIVSISVRPVALMFRLYGNVFAGENILETVMHLGGVWFGWLFVLPFYLLEILVGLVQALVFALLTSVFTALICLHDDEHAH
ncbi:F0F1 ATP synthase subunit A [Verrucomicrobia bacterium]|jgi:F-type H+-transporting ATPase subunit a|nr:F0F1 ATP synthase subunit A [Verrucomicrobiota bacterium]